MRKAKVVEQHKPSLNGTLDNKMNDCGHNESERTEISQQKIGTNSYVTR